MNVTGIAENFANGRGISKAEIEFLFAEVSRLESLAASRLADQESIEKHTARVCAEICDEIDGGYGSYASWASAEIRKRYGVEG